MQPMMGSGRTSALGLRGRATPSVCPIPRGARHFTVRVEGVAQTTSQAVSSSAKPAPTEAPPAAVAAAAAAVRNNDAPGIMAAKINAVASKINAARELARRLAEEPQGGTPEAMHNAEEASVAAATQAARADSLARALRKAEGTRDQLQRLKAENEALRDLLQELTSDKTSSQSRLNLAAGTAAMAAARADPATPVAGAETALPTSTDGDARTAARTKQSKAAQFKAAVRARAQATAAAAAPAAPVVEAPVHEVASPPVISAAVVAPVAPTPVPGMEVEVLTPESGLFGRRHSQTAHLLQQATLQQLREMSAAAVKARESFFTFPPLPVPIDGPVRLFYNRAKGPLPWDSKVAMKLGLNGWDIVQDLDLTLAADLAQDKNQQWWEAQLDLPAELYRADFVLYDKTTQTYDNNESRDYHLELSGAPTEEQLLEMRLEAYRAFEERRMAYLEKENKALWRNVELSALEAAGAARVQFRQERENTLRAEASVTVEERRRVGDEDGTTANAEAGVFSWTTLPVAGKKAYLAYNKGSGPLANCESVRVHVGYDGWWMQLTKVYDFSPIRKEEAEKAGLLTGVEGVQDWYGCWVDVPHTGLVLDFVFSDANQSIWHNNERKDFHTRVQVASAHTAEQLVELMYQALDKETQAEAQEAEDRVARGASQKALTRGDALRKRRATISEFIYTVPFTPLVGEKMEVFYNPEHTNLRGRPSIYVRIGWNRWSMDGPQGQQVVRMEPTLSAGLGFYRTELVVPEGAWSCDLIFKDTADASLPTAFFDNNGGLDYHVPVQIKGQNRPQVIQPLKIVHVAVEMAPIAKVGGMGDVVTALGRAVQDEGHEVEVVVPKYDCIDYDLIENLKQEASFDHAGTKVRVWKGQVSGLNTTFLEPENGHMWRGCIYGCSDDNVRFGFFCGAALAYFAAYKVNPSVIHCHDWQTAPMTWGPRGNAKSVFTIHNLSYGVDLVGRAMATCEVATTVSPTYAREVSGSPSVAPHLSKLYGIRNGIDAEMWDPRDDPNLPQPYGPEDVVAGKDAARRELRTRLGLKHLDVPIVSVVTRLVAQKGIHLIKHAAWRTVERGGQFVLLGSAPDPKVQAEFNALREALRARYHDRVELVFKYDEPLSHLIYAGSDMFLVPSIFEPCGLTQMIAMQYGTVPVVRKTGGLADTVFDVDNDEERAAVAGMETNGFVFESTDQAGLDYALNRALSMWYNDREAWSSLAARIMTQDWSWFSPGMDYVELYYKALRS